MKDEKRILVLLALEEHDGNWEFVERYIHCLKTAGYWVAVAVNAENIAWQSPPNQCHYVDYAKPDLDSVLIQWAKENKISLALSLGDWAAHWIGRLNQEFSWPGPTSTQIRKFTDKWESFQTCKKIGVINADTKLILAESDF